MANLGRVDLDFMRPLKVGQNSCRAASIVLAEGDPHGKVYAIYSGCAHRFKVLSDGRRQILDILFEGDLFGLDSVLAGEFDYSVEAITDLTYGVFNAARLAELYATQPSVALEFGRIAGQERQRLDAHLILIGPRSADERVAGFLLHCYERLKARDLVSGTTFALPLTQQHMADYLGITLVHTNRVLRRLQERELVVLKHREVSIHDLRALQRLALADQEARATP
jgi:CRP-like cAMP-binding protein